jgi:hypothetical protein
MRWARDRRVLTKLVRPAKIIGKTNRRLNE